MSGLPIIIVVCLGSAMFAMAAFAVTRKLMKPIDMNEHQTFLDAMFNIVGTLVSLILGLLVAAALDNYQQLEGVVDTEASGVAEVYRFCRGLPQPSRAKIESLCDRYCQLVVDEEWPAMAKGTICPALLQTFLHLNDEVVMFKPADDGETNLQSAMLQSLDNIATGRRQRILTLYSGRGKLLGPMLLISSLIVLILAYFYVKRISLFHGVVIACVVVALGGNLALIYALSRPFEGVWRIRPRAFILNIKVRQEVQKSQLVRQKP